MNKEIENKNDREREQNLTEQQQLQIEITNLENEPNKTAEQQAELATKKKRLQELERLLDQKNNISTNNAQPSDKTSLVIGGGVIGVFLVGFGLLIVRRNKNKSKY